MRLTVLGSSGTYPAAGRPGSGYLVQQDGTSIWVDAGPGTFASLCEHLAPGDLDAVVVSHRHPDHCTDVFALFHYLAYGPGAAAAVPVYVPEGMVGYLAGFVDGEAGDGALFRLLDFRVVGEGDDAEAGSLQVRFAEAAHSVPTVAVRAEGGGRSLTYSADTGPGGGVPALAAGADVFLCEATYQGPRELHPYPYHLTAAEAGAIARAAGAFRLMLTHLPPPLDSAVSAAEASSSFGAAVEVAAPGMAVDV